MKNPLTLPARYVPYLCMAGNIRTMQKCPKCGKKFPKALSCPTCLTTPTRFYIDLWHHGERLRIFSDPNGFPLDSLARTEQLLATIRHQIGSGKFDSKEYIAKELKHLQFEFYAQAWLERMEKERISRSYLIDLKSYTRRYYIPFFQRTNIRDLREGHIIDFRRWLPAHLSAKTVQNILGVLHRLLSEARDRRDIALLPKFPKRVRRDPDTKWLTRDEQESILAHVPEPYRTLFSFCLHHGCRLGEGRALKWDCIDLARGVVTIKASMDTYIWRPFTKEGDVRHLPLNSKVRQELLALPRSLTGFVFVNRRGNLLSSTRVWTTWNEAAKRVGISISPYQGTRHSFATQKLMAGYSERFVMEATGHKSIQCFRRYGKLVTETLREMIEGPSAPTVSKPSVKGNGE